MIIMKLTSPKRAQSYKTVILYESLIKNPWVQSVKNCDKDGALMIFISKYVLANDKGRFYTFDRVFGDTGQEVKIIGPTDSINTAIEIDPVSKSPPVTPS